MSKTYRYGMAGVSDPRGVADVVNGFKGVLSVDANASSLTYTLEDGTDEYEIMVAVFEACERIGGCLIVGENDCEDVGDDAENDVSKISANDSETAENEPIDGLTEEKDEVSAVIGYEEDKIVAAKKRIKSETVTRFAEIGVSAALAVVSLFIKDGGTTAFSFKNIILIVAFAIAAYETLYVALTDVVKKKWFSENIFMSLVFVCGALINSVLAMTAIAIVYAVAREIITYLNEINSLRTDEAFFTGSFSVETESGERKNADALTEGDVFLLEQYDVVPCDGTLLTSARFDCYKLGGGAEETKAEGGFVEAGAILLSESARIKAVCPNSESRIVKERKAFIGDLSAFYAPPAFLRFFPAAAFGASLAFVFIAAAFHSGGYGAGLLVYGPIGLLIASCSMLFGLFENVRECAVSAIVSARAALVGFSDEDAFSTLAKADSFRFDALALTENGKLKEDALGALKELINGGAKNVTTDFSGADLEKAVADKIDFVDRSFKGEKVVTVGDGKFVSLIGDGRVNIGNGEISFVPFAYKIARRARKAAILSTVFSAVLYAATVALAILLPARSITFAALPALFSLVFSALFALLSSRDKV